MPELCRFMGIVITMYWKDHPPPHFHASYGGDEATFDLEGNLLEGSLKRRQRRAVTAWANAHREELLRCWEHASQEEDPRYHRADDMTSIAHDRYKLVAVTSVEVLHDHVVRLGFSDGCVGDLDLAPRLRGPIFEPLMNDYDLFRQARADHDLRTIAWPNGADLAPEVLHAEAIEHCPVPEEAPAPVASVGLNVDAPDVELMVRLLCSELQRLLDAGLDINRDWQVGGLASLILDLVDQVADQHVSIEFAPLVASVRKELAVGLESPPSFDEPSGR